LVSGQRLGVRGTKTVCDDRGQKGGREKPREKYPLKIHSTGPTRGIGKRRKRGVRRPTNQRENRGKGENQKFVPFFKLLKRGETGLGSRKEKGGGRKTVGGDQGRYLRIPPYFTSQTLPEESWVGEVR